MVPISMPLSDLWLRFQGRDISRHWTSQKRHYRMVTCPMTLTNPNLDFKITTLLKSNISVLYWGQSWCRTPIGNHRWQIDPCRFQWPWVTLKDRMRGIAFFFTRILITLVRSPTSSHLHKCVARFVSDSWVSCPSTRKSRGINMAY